MKLILKENLSELAENTPVSITHLEAFNKMLNEPPQPNEIEVNKFAGNSKYVPISHVQMLLDELFLGLWKTTDFKYSVIANEIVGSITLHYFHPLAKIWLTREGAAAVMIQQSAGADITNIGAKIKNTLGKDHPHLMASCTMSAARTIGKAFGRDLNRKLEDNYTSFYAEIAASDAITSLINWDEITTRKQLGVIWRDNADLHTNKNFLKSFTYHSNKLPK